MNCKAQQVKLHLTKLIQTFESGRSLASSNMTEAFTKQLWKKHVPKAIQAELNTQESVKIFIKHYFDILNNETPVEFAQNYPNLMSYFNNNLQYVITHDKNIIISLESLENIFSEKNSLSKSDFQFKEYMSEKKLHEVKLTCNVASSLCNLTNSKHIVDIGGGKGYLSTILTLQHSLKVLSLDSSDFKTCGAAKMSKKMASFWRDGIFNKIKGKFPDANKKIRAEFVESHSKLELTYITPDTKIKNILEKNFNEEIKKITMTGLHTCGNLAPTSLKLFINNNEIKSVVNFGCCYNLITEEFLTNTDDENHEENDKDFGFPMSNFLKEKKFHFGHQSKMVASYGLEKLQTTTCENKMLHTSMFFRAILQTIIEKNLSLKDRVKIGKLAYKIKSFHEYITKANEKCNLNLNMDEKDTAELYDRYLNEKPKFIALFFLRITLAPIIESIILLDRYLFLLENGIENAYLVKVFDLKISPRGFAIVAWRD